MTPKANRQWRHENTLRGFQKYTGNPTWYERTEACVDKGELYSMSHPRPYRSGGPFYLSRDRDHATTIGVSTSDRRGNVWLTWGIPFDVSFSYGFSTSTLSDSTMEALGTTAIARSLPTNPTSSMAQFLGELRQDGIPSIMGSHLWKERTGLAKAAGHEYLNLEFGWKPFVSDLQKFAHAIKDSHKIVRAYQKGSDRKIRVSRDSPVDLTPTHSVTSSYIPVGPNAGWAQGSLGENQKERRWFVGAYRYHIPTGDTFWDRAQRYEAYANKLLGTRITPELVWELTPWSWAVDWFSNVGDVVHNVSALGADGLAMLYGYQMRHLEIYRYVSGTSVYGALSRSRLIEVKQRVSASPYGFGVSWDGMTNRQLAITAALGITRR